MVVNNCEEAKTIDEKYNLKTYAEDNSAKCKKMDETGQPFYISTKIMTKDASSPEEFLSNHTLTTFFTNRQRIGIMEDLIITGMNSAIKKTVNFDYQ